MENNAMEVTREDREAASALANEICGCSTRQQHKRDIEAVLAYRTTALAAKEAENAELRAKVERLLAAVDALGLRGLVAGWNGENRDDGPYSPHPPRLGVTLRTNAGQVYELDAAAEAARATLAETQP